MNSKILLALIATIMGSMFSKAQEVPTAILQHGEEVTVYYGGNALKKAVDAAAEADVISLSGGTFSAPSITKPISIQGAGYEQSPEYNKFRTFIKGKMSIDLTNTDQPLILEGLYFGDDVIANNYIKGIRIMHCFIEQTLQFETNENVILLHDRIYYLRLNGTTTNASLNNCVIANMFGSDSSEDVCLVNHCTLGDINDNIKSYTFKNSVIHKIRSYSTYNSYYNNIYWQGSIPKQCQQNNNHTYHTYPTYNLINSPDIVLKGNYNLIDSLRDYKSDDGTEIGIHGGSMPFTNTPAIPQVTSKSVSKQSDENNKISVKFTIEAQ